MQTKVKIFIGCLIVGLCIMFGYNIFRGFYLARQNETYEIEEYSFTSDNIKDPDKMKINGKNAASLEREGEFIEDYEDEDERIIINGQDMTDVYKEIEMIDEK